ncbi:MAG: STAS domain-containing protein [Deltaproteobacteria bacterium]
MRKTLQIASVTERSPERLGGAEPALTDGWLPALLERDGIRLLMPHGEIDRAGFELIERAVDPRVRFGGPEVVLDLSHVTHLDYRRVGTLLRMALTLRDEGGDLRLAGASPYLLTVLTAAGLEGRLRHHATAREAMAGYRAERAKVSRAERG